MTVAGIEGRTCAAGSAVTAAEVVSVDADTSTGVGGADIGFGDNAGVSIRRPVTIGALPDVDIGDAG